MAILIVDDNEENRYLLEILLRGNGYAVISAANGEEAISAITSGDIQLIISDILMPVMDGFELCRRVKNNELMRHIPFIVYTATYTGPQDEAFAIKIGADRFIQKPCEPTILMQNITEIMDSIQKKQPAPTPLASEEDVLKLYNERLVRKLEQKMLQLEKEVQARREADEIAQTAAERWQITFDSMLDPVALINPDGSIIQCNKAFAALVRLSPEATIGKKCYSLVHGGADLADGCPLQKSLETGSRETIAMDLEPNNYIIVTDPVKNSQGQITGFVHIMRDTTELKRAEEEREKIRNQLFHAQKMESIGRLAGGVAHDYNNMLAVIIGYTEQVLEKVNPEHPLHADLWEIYKAARRSTNITRQLLAFARKQTADPVVLDLNLAVEGMLSMLRRLVGEDLDVLWKPADGLYQVRIDPSQLDQILANLCVNARDAITGSGRVTIETANAQFDQAYCEEHPGYIPGDYVLLSVSDDGCGMDKETIGKIFEPFFTTKEVGHGTGLGLAMVYGIVKQNNGFINVYSEPGCGSTFSVYFPQCENAQPEAAPAELSPSIPASHGETVLIVEDEPAVLNMTKKMLERLGYHVLATNLPMEALEIAAKNPNRIHILITDVVMPEMNGKEIASRLCSEYPGMKLLFMSGYTPDAMAHRGVLEEGADFIQKPFSMKNLAIKVRAVLDSA